MEKQPRVNHDDLCPAVQLQGNVLVNDHFGINELQLRMVLGLKEDVFAFVVKPRTCSWHSTVHYLVIVTMKKGRRATTAGRTAVFQYALSSPSYVLLGAVSLCHRRDV